jgi:uncharacterized protein YrrD
MNTYYKQDNGNFIETPISVDDAIAAIVQTAVTNAVNKVNDIIINSVTNRVECALIESNIKAMVDAHLETADITNIVDEAVGNAVNDYDYDSVIEAALDDIDIDEMVTEKVTDYLDSTSIQVRIS